MTDSPPFSVLLVDDVTTTGATLVAIREHLAGQGVETVPLALGAVDTLFELRMTSGWAFRPEGTTAISMVYQ